MKKTLLCALAVITITVWAPASRAVIIDHGNYTTDTTTGLDWLDLTQTVNISKTDMLSMLVTGGQYDGWRYASTSDLMQLISDYTSVPYSMDPYSRFSMSFQLGQIDPLITLLGSTSSSAQYRSTLGFTSDFDIMENFFTPSSYVAELVHSLASLTPEDRTILQAFSYPNSAGARDIGHFLVRQTDVARVPAPGIMMILLPGLALLGFSKRRAV